MNARYIKGLAWAAALWTGTLLAQTELQPGQQYAAGSALKSSSLGIALTMPRDWLGAYRQSGDQSVLVLGSNVVEGVGMAIMLRNQTPASISALMNDAQDLGDNVVLRLDGAVTTQAGRMSARYQNALYVGRALAVLGPRNTHVVYFYAGPRKNEAVYGQLLQNLAASTRFSEPVAAPVQAAAPAQTAPTGSNGDWQRFLAGMMLKYLSSYNSGGGGGGMATERSMHFCSDGSFAYVGSSSMSIYVPGATAGGGGSRRDVGRWRVISSDQEQAEVLLVSDSGEEERLHISYDGQKTFVGNQRWFRVESDVCG